jgi:hypothetical protein
MGFATGNFVSWANAIKINGYYLYTGNLAQFLMDSAAYKIATVFPCTIKNASGVDTAAFKFTLVNSKGITADTIYLPQNQHLTSIADVDAGLTAISGNNDFTTYTSLVRGSDFPTGWYTGVSVLINDTLCHRNYVPDNDETWVYVDIQNSLSRVQYVFSGDQTFAGNQYYFYVTGNVDPF